MPERPFLIDHQSVRDLANESSPAIAVKFLSDYLGMLPARLNRILTGLGAEDAEVSMDAILSLKIASAMTGALAVEASCRALESLVRRGFFQLAHAEAGTLRAIVAGFTDRAPAVVEQVRAEIGHPGDGHD